MLYRMAYTHAIVYTYTHVYTYAQAAMSVSRQIQNVASQGTQVGDDASVPKDLFLLKGEASSAQGLSRVVGNSSSVGVRQVPIMSQYPLFASEGESRSNQYLFALDVDMMTSK